MSIKMVYHNIDNILCRTDLLHIIHYINKFSKSKDLLLVEIGTFQGGSTFFFSKFFNHVITIDPYDNVNAERDFLANLGKFNNISKIRMKSEDAVNLFNDNIIDVLYIDGNHDKEFITKDILLWLPKIKENGFISGHDYYKKEDVSDEEKKRGFYVGDVFDVVNEILGTPEYKDNYMNWIFQKKNIKENIYTDD